MPTFTNATHDLPMHRPTQKPFSTDCPTCIRSAEFPGRIAPYHNGSARCESGSIASGGNHSHCACNICF